MTERQYGTRREFLKFSSAAVAGSIWTFGPHAAVVMGLPRSWAGHPTLDQQQSCSQRRL
ncbi:twin-arginine translocation signal domain-containing protein [Alloacidobacterium sp.]|uniref:twin-arginine translocation signal domain-containing protein n=1 Tax=Alloacidobacterium sp. TaxID=2951999 RepID=UPI0039C86C50